MHLGVTYHLMSEDHHYSIEELRINNTLLEIYSYEGIKKPITFLQLAYYE